MKRGQCPKCGGRLKWRCRVDSDDRIEAKWRACADCPYDARVQTDTAFAKELLASFVEKR